MAELALVAAVQGPQRPPARERLRVGHPLGIPVAQGGGLLHAWRRVRGLAQADLARQLLHQAGVRAAQHLLQGGPSRDT